MAITLRFASTAAEREAIYHPRYDIYIDEMRFAVHRLLSERAADTPQLFKRACNE